jgi:hypothetical protein
MSIYAVNGKEPVAAWIPSLDTAGNGTTTLTDLVGSNNGTLTDMDAATDWVADTGAGGVRALDFDGTNDLVIASGVQSSVAAATKATIAGWIKRTGTAAAFGFGAVSGSRFNVVWFGGTIYFQAENGGASYPYCSLSGSGWVHIASVFDGSLSGWGRVVAYINGTLCTLTPGGSFPASSLASAANLGNFEIGRNLSGGNYTTGLHDDIRLFVGQSLNADDISYLYNSGNGRGRVVEAATAYTFHPLQRANYHPLRYT